MRADLHVHSTFSDGTNTPRELVSIAQNSGVCALALCDHNTVAGLDSFMEAGEGSGVSCVCGTEISADRDGTEVHILGLFIPRESFGAVSALAEENNRAKRESNIALCNALADAGYDISYDELIAATPTGQINRAHVARCLTERGYTPSIKDAFNTLLRKNGEFYTEPRRVDALRAISALNSAGAVVVLAHPLLNLSAEQLDEFLPAAKQSGLDGMECYYSEFDAMQQELMLSYAEKYGLIPSGGSDYHGTNKPKIQLGTGQGDLLVPMAAYDALAERAGQKQKRGAFI
jgi:hypothetical protein